MAKFVIALGVLCFAASGGQSSADERTINSVQELIQAGKLREAFQLLSTALKQHPKDAGLLNLRGVIHAEQNELAEARHDFERATALEPGLTAAWRNLARSCGLGVGATGEGLRCAASAWRHVLAVRPDDPEALFSLASVYEQQGSFAASLRELAMLPKVEADRSHALALQCADLSGLGRLPEATQVAKRLVNAAEFSEADVESVLGVLKPSSPAAARSFDSGRAALVVTLVESLDARGSASPALLGQLVLAYEQLSRLRDARSTLERLAAADPNNPKHLFELGRVAYRLHDLEGALGYLGHARDLTPADPQIHFLMGMILVELKLPLDARKSLDKALTLDSGNPDYNYAMGSIVLNSRDAADAVPYFRTYVAARPQDPRGHFALGIAYFAAKDYENCRTEMLGVSRDPKTEVGAAYFLGRVARINENFDEAATFLNRAISLSPDFAQAYAELAHVRLRQDRLDDARAAINRALSLSPNNFQANSTLLTLYQRTRDPRAAAQAARLNEIDQEREKAMELMLRSVEVKPY